MDRPGNIERDWFAGGLLNMLIIMNPPYGYASSLSIPITRAASQVAEQVLCLAPLKTFKAKGIKEYVESLKIHRNVGELFPGVQTNEVCAVKLTPKVVQNKDLFREFILNDKQIAYQNAVDRYNKLHKSSYRAQSDIIGKDLYESVYMKDFDKIFLITWRCEGNGVHSTASNAKDVRHNLYGETSKCIGGSASGLIFNDKLSRDNFAKWWYSCENIPNGISQKKGLTNWILQYLVTLQAGGGRMKFYLENFPSLDWSHPWTDKEILKEIKLPEDFLEKEWCK